ncbi:PAS domain S-box-containing protein [Nocardioides massiliensis]|uniref:histidine kinase n=3 Tax=Nocardioides massiliensis TaxID=1325935 RepID=A0ABT9NMK9_9ACTN|nr:ATP-binding protein [Nocardioides massiliensis]MDP9821280.1 PAS domain S-box-containing protein [Nocardioides massiliensis]
MRMPESDAARLFGLLGLTSVFGVVAVVSTPSAGTAIGIWPIVGATAAFIFTGRPAWPLLTVLVGLIGFATLWVDRPAGAAAGLGVGLALQAAVTWRVWCRGERRVIPSLLTNGDLSRLLTAVVAGAAVMAICAALTSAVTGWGEPRRLALAAATAGLASQLVLLPLLARLGTRTPAAGRGELAAQWVNIVVLAPFLFFNHAASVTLILILPTLMWGALRSHAYQAFAQLVVVAGVAVTLTTAGIGPLTGPGFGRFGPDSRGILLAVFVGTCALVVLTLVVSVGEQAEQQRQLAAERDRVERIVHGTSGVAIIGTDLDLNITLFNPGAERLYGYRAAEVLGGPVSVLSSHLRSDREVEREDDPAALTAGPRVLRIRRRDGAIRQHLLVVSPVRDDRGVEIGYVTTAEDITERIETEERLREALEAERAASERLREVDQAKDTFVSNVSHELRTPITSILGYTELLAEGAYGDLTKDQTDAVRRIARNSNRLLSLIADLLTLSRIQESGVGLADRELDLVEVVSAAMALVGVAYERRDLDVSVDLPPTPMPYRGDREQLERVVLNLLSNAVKFTPDGGRVTVRLADDGAHAVLEVTDTGIGIPADELEQLFERFFRSTLSQHNEIPGTGLGLPITRTIVERHGGRIEVDSEVGRGTTVRVRLPARHSDGPTPRTDPVRIAP